jgi:hypothetical protein
MKAPDILLSLGSKYAAAAAYRDVGRVVFPHRGESTERATIGSFRTAFVRSKGFRFEYREMSWPKHPHERPSRRTFGIRVQQGAVVDIRGFESSRESVGLAVASMTGITFGAGYYALRLLLPSEIPGRALSEAPTADLVREHRIDGERRFAIRLKEWSANEIIVDESVLWRVAAGGGDVRVRQLTGVMEPSFTTCRGV